MVRYYFGMILVLHCFFVSAQTTNNEETEMVLFLGKSPVFNGDAPSFVANVVKYSDYKYKDSLEGNVYVSFWIDTLGNMVEGKIVRGLNEDCDKEVLRALKFTKFESPAMSADSPISVKLTMPVKIKKREPFVKYYNINDYIELDVINSKDTVSWGDELAFDIVFKNLRDSAQLFYPKALLYLERCDDDTTSIDEECEVNGVCAISSLNDLHTYKELSPHGSCKYPYKVRVTKNLFSTGVNTFRVVYICYISLKVKVGRRDYKYVICEELYENKHNGILVSHTFDVYVK